MNLLAELRAQGLTLSLDGDNVRVQPRAAISPAARDAIRAGLDDLRKGLRLEQRLRRLIALVGSHYRCTTDELVIMEEAARSDPQGAISCLEYTAALHRLQ